MIYRTLLRLYPREFRHRYADELEADFAALSREARQSGRSYARLRCWGYALADLLVSIPREWLRTPWVPVLGVAASVASGVFYYVVGRIYEVRSFASETQPPESPELLLLMGLMATVPIVATILVGLALRFHRRHSPHARRRV
jgi:hypothetical protein